MTTPGHVPGTQAAMRWVAGTLFGCTVEELAAKEAWDLEGKKLTDPELVARVALLLGRASAVHSVTSVALCGCELGATGGKVIGEALGVNTTLKSIRFVAICLPCQDPPHIPALPSAPFDTLVAPSFTVFATTTSARRDGAPSSTRCATTQKTRSSRGTSRARTSTPRSSRRWRATSTQARLSSH